MKCIFFTLKETSFLDNFDDNIFQSLKQLYNHNCLFVHLLVFEIWYIRSLLYKLPVLFETFKHFCLFWWLEYVSGTKKSRPSCWSYSEWNMMTTPLRWPPDLAMSLWQNTNILLLNSVWSFQSRLWTTRSYLCLHLQTTRQDLLSHHHLHQWHSLQCLCLVLNICNIAGILC